MDERSDMSLAEKDIRLAFAKPAGLAINELMAAYSRRAPADRDAFVAALVGNLISLRALCASAKTGGPSA
jgi:hypothetical protein